MGGGGRAFDHHIVGMGEGWGVGGGGRAFDHHIVGMGEGWGVGAGHLTII